MVGMTRVRRSFIVMIKKGMKGCYIARRAMVLAIQSPERFVKCLRGEELYAGRKKQA